MINTPTAVTENENYQNLCIRNQQKYVYLKN